MLTNKLHAIFKKLEPEFSSSNYLLAVSGGRDSVALAHLLAENKIKFTIAHCNFQLRGEESNQEEEFVKLLAETLNVKILTKKFDTQIFAETEKISIQEAARKLRYNWFFEVLEKENFTKLITAHHADDDVETFLINLQRGSGIKGLAGIPDNNDKVLRPLLQVSRKEIDVYIVQNTIAFKEDSSNQSDKYLRNAFRLKLVPYLEQNYPDLLNGLQNTLPVLKQNKALFESLLHEKKSQLIQKSNDVFTIKFEELLSQKEPLYLLYELITDFGFNFESAQNVFDSITSSETKHFYSENYFITKNRTNFSIQVIQNKKSECNEFLIDKELTQLNSPISVKFDVLKSVELINFTANSNIQYLDFEKLKFPLLLRKARVGDKFKPLGMQGYKKLSDFFIDLKFSENQKQNTWVLESNSQIVCIVNHRISDDFKITKSTTIGYKIEFL
ncbi:MAG: tRNA lysidine(34) synthetase TilS [Bacteroidota bacterium]